MPFQHIINLDNAIVYTPSQLLHFAEQLFNVQSNEMQPAPGHSQLPIAVGKRLAASCFGSAHNGDLANMKTHKRKQHQIKTTNGRHDKRF